MFTGIIETLGEVKEIQKNQNNLNIIIESEITKELKIDQSISHNGCCLTVVDMIDNQYKVTAIKETLDRTNFMNLKKHDKINLERCLRLSDRLDGHLVQGHIDQVGTLTKIQTQNGSNLLTFLYDPNLYNNFTIEKGSICVNGISLTVVESGLKSFSVAIIPYTWENTNLKFMKIGDQVNLEFDILGKYIKKLYQLKTI